MPELETTGRSPASFRDPAGFVFEADGRVFRQINRSGVEDFEALMATGLYDRLASDGWLVPHRDATIDPPLPELAARVIEPERVDFISYPYEWCFGQWKAAALRTLAIQRRAIEHGLSLKDATAYNIAFRGPEPVFIDTLSFEKYVEGEPWVAYRQFCQHFLAPLALMARVDVRLGQLSRVYRDGVPLDLAARLLPWRSRLRPGLLMHIHLHAGLQRGAADRPGAVPSPDGPRRAAFGKGAMLGLVGSLESAVNGLSWEPGRSGWANYENDNTYSAADRDQKAKFLAGALDEIGPRSVWDLGANTGRYSRLASSRGIPTVAFDLDVACVEWNYRQSARDGESRLLPLQMDLTDPSPGLGWANRERSPLADRGPADLVFALALIHHLAIGGNVPLPDIAAYFARLGRSLVVEFVPKDDPQTRRLLAGRRDVFDDYSEAGFRRAFDERFELIRRERIEGTGRDLYLLRRKDDR